MILPDIENTLIDNALDGVVVVDQDGIIIVWNRQAELIFGWSADEALGAGMADLIIPPEHRISHHHGMDRYIMTGEHAILNKRIEIVGLHKSGRIIPIELTVTPKLASGRHTFIAFVRDITERRAAQDTLERRVEERTAELHKQSAFLKATLDNITDGIVACDAEGRISLFNRATEDLLRLPSGELLPPDQWVSFYDAYDADGEKLTPARRPLYRALKDGMVCDCEIIIVPKEGRARTLMINGQALYDGNGTKIGAVNSMRDITGERDRERELAMSRAFLRTLIDAVADPIFVKDREHRWVEGNKAFWELLGGEDAARNKTDYDLFPKDQADHFWEGDERVFAGALFDGEESLRRPDGTDMTIATKKVSFLFPDGRQGIVGVIRDVTLQRAMEAELRRHRDHLQDLVAEQTADLTEAKERAESANIAKTEFLANMSHEIRTPMNAVVGLAHILAISTPLSDKQKQFIGTLQSSAATLLSLLDDLLDIAKIEAHSVDLEFIPFAPAGLLRETVNMLAVRAAEKKIALTFDDGGLDGQMYKGDPTRLRQIVLNLCSNAIKFTERGSVDLSLRAETSTQPGYDTLVVCVRDSGIGIPPEQRDSIFQKFVQADSSITRKYGGTGLGLAITKTLVEIMGGDIRLDSAVGEGSVFTIRLTLSRHAGNAQDSPVASLLSDITELRGASGPLILIVEDHRPNQLVATTFLESWGYRCDIARDGIEALEMTKARDYAAILMDVQMPVLNGFDATRQIRAREAVGGGGARVPIIGMTAHALSGDREKCLASGMDDYISKPFDPDVLHKTLEGLTKIPSSL